MNRPFFIPGGIFDIANKLAGYSDNLRVIRNQTSNACGLIFEISPKVFSWEVDSGTVKFTHR